MPVSVHTNDNHYQQIRGSSVTGRTVLAPHTFEILDNTITFQERPRNTWGQFQIFN